MGTGEDGDIRTLGHVEGKRLAARLHNRAHDGAQERGPRRAGVVAVRAPLAGLAAVTKSGLGSKGSGVSRVKTNIDQ